MDFPLSGDFWAAMTGSYLRSSRTAPAMPTELDLASIRLVYEFIAGQTMCERCGKPLGRELLLEAWAATVPSSWQVQVITQCSSWRRHRHTAVVTEVRGALRLGSLSSRRTAE
jgi:hypothetical protein